MIKQTDFNAMIELAMTTPDRVNMRPVIEKELLHYDILFSLDKEGLLNSLTFQGGTSLRLCHNSPRFSEGLDFAGGPDFSSRQLQGIKSCIEHYVGRRYGLEVSVKEPAELQGEADYVGRQVLRFFGDGNQGFATRSKARTKCTGYRKQKIMSTQKVVT